MWRAVGRAVRFVLEMRSKPELADTARTVPLQKQAKLVAVRSKLFVIAGRCGRLANRLVLFANFIALAEEQGHRVMNPTFHSYATLFEATRRDIYCEYPVRKRQSWLDVVPGFAGAIRGTRLFFRVARAWGGLNERFPVFGGRVVTLRQTPDVEITALDGAEVQKKIDHARIILVNGWNFRVPDLVRRHASKIRTYFQPIKEFERASGEAVERLRQRAEVVIGVHIRRGDYSTWKGGKCFFSIERYADWMRQLAEQFPGRKVSFLICSDETRTEREFCGLSVGFGPDSPVGDLYALAKCDYIFGPISTYSQWASFYGDKPLFHLHDKDDRLERGRFSVSDLKEVP